MKESIHRYFQVGTVLWMSFPADRWEYEESLTKVLRDDFFDAVEIAHIGDAAQRERARKLLAQSHMKICFGAQPRLLGEKKNPNALEEKERESAEKLLMDAVDEAEFLGAKGIAFLSGNWEQKSRERAFLQLKRTTGNVCRYAAKKGMYVNLEVFDYDMDKKALIGPAPLAARFAAEMREEVGNFGLLADLSHFPTTYEDSRFVIQTLRPWISHLHIGNAVVKEGCPGFGDRHPRFGYPHSANDVEQLAEFFRILKEEGFFRPEDPMVLSMEVTPQPGEDAEIVLANTKRTINRAWAVA